MSRQARVGLLVLAGILLFLVTLFAIANRSFLFSDTFTVRARYNSVAGLQPGASVQYQGVNVGRVETIRLPEKPGGPITVSMAIKQDARPLVNPNTQAQIKTSGLVGNQIVVLVNPPGQPATAGQQLESGDFIRGVEPFDLYEITDQALAAVDTFATVAVEAQQIMQDIQSGEGTLGKFLYDPELYNRVVATTEEAEQTLSGISRSAEQIVATAEDATEGVNTILTKVNEGEGTVARMLNDPSVYTTLLAASDTLQNIAGDLRSITQSAENAANWAALGSYRFAENMEALKHNFLFRRYFEERGYYEKAPFEVREQALEASYRQLQSERRELEKLKERYRQLIEEVEEEADPEIEAQADPPPEDPEAESLPQAQSDQK